MYTYFDLSNGIKLCQTDDINIVRQAKRLYVGKDISDEHVLALLKGGIIMLTKELHPC